MGHGDVFILSPARYYCHPRYNKKCARKLDHHLLDFILIHNDIAEHFQSVKITQKENEDSQY